MVRKSKKVEQEPEIVEAILNNDVNEVDNTIESDFTLPGIQQEEKLEPEEEPKKEKADIKSILQKK